MSRISIPIDALTSRLNLGDRFSAVRSQSLGQRFANLKPVSEFLDLKRLSKPRDFADVQARVNYNLGYFSSNYAVVFVMLTIYSLLTNWWLLFDIILVAGGMWAIGKLGGSDLEIGTFRATTSQLYTSLACLAVPIAFIASPISTFLWLIGATGTYRECFFRGGGLGGRPRTPYGVPHWGRPPGARLGRVGRDAWGRYDGWDIDRRFEEVEDSDDGFHGGVELDYGYGQPRFHPDELAYDEPGSIPPEFRRHRSDENLADEAHYFEDDNRGGSGALTRRRDMQLVMREKEEDLVERALERIARARALGKTNVRLSQAEIDALDRLEQRQREPVRSLPIQASSAASMPKSTTNNRKGTPTKGKVKEVKKAKNSEKSASPKPKPSASRTRGRSTASDQSTREVNMSDYPLPPEPYAYPPSGMGFGPGYYGIAHPASRQSSSQSLRGMQTSLQHPYYQSRYYGPPDEAYERRPSSKSSRASRPDPSEPDWEPTTKSRSNSALLSYPLDQLPNHSQTSRAPRFDPADPRYGSPQKRVVSGPPDVRHYRAPDEDDSLEVMSYRVPSSSEGSEESSDDGVQVEVLDRATPTGSYSVKTTRGAAAALRSSAGNKPAGKSGRRK